MTADGPRRRLLIVGRGRMGQQVEALCGEYGFEVAGTVDQAEADAPDDWPDADVAIDFSIAEAVPVNVPRLARRGIDMVIGTTGWSECEADLRRAVEACPVGVVAAANFALGVNLFEALVEEAARLMAAHPQYGAWIHELHHAAKRDAPSGTALTLLASMRRAGYDAAIDVSSTRAGAIPGTHTIGFDGASETLTLTHVARDRSIFARGALEAARWVRGRRGWFTMRDVLGLAPGGPGGTPGRG
jgi:4-hydroxy-tetrahydrodipicolinate reductase